MSITQYQLSWDSFKNNVCDGFSSLQQNAEFVDMTLAADGYLVKVHKSILALASPYIKSLLQSTTNEHPIIFLSNVSHEVLIYILTYVYTGEVSVEVNKMQSFMKVAKDLRLSGLFGTPVPKVNTKDDREICHEDFKNQRFENNVFIPDTENSIGEKIIDNSVITERVSPSGFELRNSEIRDTTTFDKQISDSTEYTSLSTKTACEEPDLMASEEIGNNRDNGLYVTADGYQYKLELKQTHNYVPNSSHIVIKEALDNPSELTEAVNSINTADTSNHYNNGNFGSFEDEFKKKINSPSLDLGHLDPKGVTLQYTMSNRGSLQLILNRYMYYCHHQSHGGRKRRWRCIDYRSKHCPAFIDTDNEIMTSRKFRHPHSFHDEKIRKKMKKDLIFTNLNILLEKQNEKNKNKEEAS